MPPPSFMFFSHYYSGNPFFSHLWIPMPMAGHISTHRVGALWSAEGSDHESVTEWPLLCPVMCRGLGRHTCLFNWTQPQPPALSLFKPGDGRHGCSGVSTKAPRHRDLCSSLHLPSTLSPLRAFQFQVTPPRPPVLAPLCLDRPLSSWRLPAQSSLHSFLCFTPVVLCLHLLSPL